MRIYDFNDKYDLDGPFWDRIRWLHRKITDSKWFNFITWRAKYREEYIIRYNEKVELMVSEFEKSKKYTHIFTADHPLKGKSISGRFLIIGDGALISNCTIYGGTKKPTIEVKTKRNK